MVYLVGENPIGVLSDELSWTLSPELYILSYFLDLQAFCIWFGINVIILKGWLIDEQTRPGVDKVKPKGWFK